MKKIMHYLGPVLVAAIFLLAVWLLYHKLKTYSLEDIRQSFERIPNTRVALACLFVVLNYAILVAYDGLAIRAIDKSLPLKRLVLVSFVGQAVSYNFGALLGGTSVRFRFYTSWGFSISEIVRLVLMLAVTFWVGVLGLSGLLFVLYPPHLPAELQQALPVHNLRILGGILFAIAIGYLVLCFTVRTPIQIRGKVYHLPPPKIAVAQLIVACVDILVAAAIMYALMPEEMGIGFIEFVPTYLMAQVAVVLSHVPGGVGVFELLILHLTNPDFEKTVIAVVLLFRVLYFIIPLLLAALVFLGYEVQQQGWKMLLKSRQRKEAQTKELNHAPDQNACSVDVGPVPDGVRQQAARDEH